MNCFILVEKLRNCLESVWFSSPQYQSCGLQAGQSGRCTPRQQCMMKKRGKMKKTGRKGENMCEEKGGVSEIFALFFTVGFYTRVQVNSPNHRRTVAVF